MDKRVTFSEEGALQSNVDTELGDSEYSTEDSDDESRPDVD